MMVRKKKSIYSDCGSLRLFWIVFFSCLMSLSSYSWATSLLSNVPEAGEYDLAYEVSIPTTLGTGWNSTPVPYSVNNATNIANGSFSRVAYYVEAVTTGGATQWVYVSMHTFTNDATKLGVPNVASGEFYHYGITGPITNANIYASGVSITTGTVINTVNIEFWPSNYGTGNDYGVPGANGGNFDFGDGGANTGAGHSSMQIHNYGALQTIFGFNHWGPGGSIQFGLGTQGSGNPDWTFNDSNVNNYSTRTLQILIYYDRARTEPATDVTQTSMTLNGEVVRTNGLTYAWMFWGPADGGTNKLSWTHSAIVPGGAQPTGQVSTAISSLTPQTTYYHRLYVSNAVWQAWAPTSKSVATLNSFTWDGDVDDLWWNTNNWAGSNVPDTTNEYAVFSVTGVGSVDLQEFSYTIGSLTFLYGGYNLVDPNETPGTLTMGSITNMVGTNTINVGVTLSGDAVVKGGTLVLADSENFSANSIILSGGNLTIQGPLTMTTGKLNHRGYDFYNDNYHNLNANGGLLAQTPSAQVYLTTGPGDRGLDFNDDNDFINSGTVSISDYYMNLFEGYLVAQETGIYEFRIYQSDDICTIWLDLDRDGVFEAPGGYGTGENMEYLVWANYGATWQKSLIAGQYYRFAATHREGGGGSTIDVRFKSPSMGSQAVIKPGDPTQSAYWAVGGFGSASMTGAPIVVATNATLTVVSDSTVSLGGLVVFAGSTLTLSCEGTDSGVTFTDAAVTGNVTITSGDVVMNNFSQSANSVITISSAASLTVDNALNLNTIYAAGTIAGPGTITASTKMSFEPTQTITNALAGGAVVYYGENRTINGIITATGANTYSGGTYIRRAALRATDGAGLPATGCLRFSSWGDWEYALLETSGTFTRNVGTGSGQVYWQDRGGFSAYGGPLDVDLEGGATMLWGNADQGFRGQWLQLNSEYSDNAVDIKNPVDLETGNRNLLIRDNSSVKTDMAVFSGTISSGASSANWLYRRGNGLLWLKGTNTFQHRVFFEDCGPIRADDGIGMSPNCSVRFGAAGTGYPAVWEAKGTITRTIGIDGIAGNVNWENGHGGFSAYGGKLTVTLSGGAQINWGAAYTAGFTNRWLLFGSYYSDDEVELTNPIDLNASTRNIAVFDNTDTNTDLTVLSGNITGSGPITTFFSKFSNGILWLKGNNTYTQAIWIDDGVVRGDWGVGIPTTTQIYFEQNDWSRPGVWEMSGAITNNIGAAGEAGTVTWDAQNGGFAAYGGPLTVNLEGGAQLNTTTVADGFDWHWLQLGSYSADNVVDFQNDILIVNDGFQMSVFDNPYSTTDYAILSGNITYSGWGDMEVRGSGLLKMTGTNTIRQFRTYGTTKVFINGYHASSDYVMTENNDSTTIGGTGTIDIYSWMDIRASGIIAPGDTGVGTLSISVERTGTGNGLEFYNGAIYECELGGVSNDRVALAGDLILNNTWTLKLLDAGASPKVTDQFDILTYSGNLYSSLAGSNVASVLIDCGSLPSHYVTNSLQVINDIVGKRIYVTGLSSTLSIGNEDATGVTDTNAVLNGTLSCTGLAFDVYAYWGETDEGQTTNGWSNAFYVASYTNVTEQALVHPTDSNLTGNTVYYYTFRASNDTYDIWAGASETFTTLGIPVVTNGSGALSVAAGRAQLNGEFVDHNRGDVTICWGLADVGTNDISVWDHVEVLGTQSSALFQTWVTEVYYPLTYYYRCFATNAYGYGWSEPAGSFSVTNRPANHAPASGLLGQWTFDDDTCDDSSGNGYDGEKVGGAYDAGDVPVALTNGQSLDLRGGDYYVKVDTGGAQDVFNLNELSVSCWVKGWPVNDWGPFVAKRGEGGQGWQFRKNGNSADRISWTLRGPGNDDWYVTTNINDSAWHHLVATYGGGKRRIYVDNTKVGEEDRTGAIAGTTDMLTFGVRQNSAALQAFARVRLDDICIYNRAITTNEVGILYSNTPLTIISITNTAVSDVTTTSAQFNAMFSGTNAVYQIFGYWGTNNGGTDISAWSNSVDLGWYTNYVGAISHYATNDINATTTNYYAFRVTNALDNIWADPSWSYYAAVAPTVDNGSGAVTTATGVATLRGELTAGNYANIYIYWGTNDGVEVKGDWSGVVDVGGVLDGTFAADVPAGHGVTYYYRCYATNAVGQNWADSTTNFIMSVPSLLPLMTVTNGLVYHLKADSLGYANNDPVVQWDDVSGNSRHFTNSTAAARPLFKTASLNGLPTVYFDGSDDQLTYTGITTHETVFIVNSITAADGNDGIWGSSNPGDRGIRMQNATAWNGQGGSGGYVWDFSWDTGGTAYMNGVPTVNYGGLGNWHILEMKRGSGFPTSFNITHLGWYYSGRLFNGSIAEVLVYNRALSTNEHNSVGNYLAQKYDLSSTYPVSHYLHLTNDTPTSVLETEAVFNATLNGAGRVFHVYVYWDEVDGGNDVSAWTGGSAYVGAFTNFDGAVSCNATTDLAANTGYYYNFRATNDFTNLWGGASVLFRTLGVPVVSNAAATAVTSSSATLNGVLAAGGSANVRIYWGTNDPGEVYTGWDHTNDFGEVLEGALSVNVSVLAGGTYYYRVYATNSILNQEDWPGGATNFTAPQAAVSLSLGTAGFAPTNLPGCVLWLDANDIDGDSDTGDNPANGDPVFLWKDRSGSGHHANNSGGTPHYVTAGPNGKPVVHFTANDSEYLYTTYNFDALSKYSILSVSRYTGGVNNGRVIASKTRNWLFGHHGAFEDRFHAEGWIYEGHGAPSSNWRLYAGTVNDDANPLGNFWGEGIRLSVNNGGSSDTLYKPGQIGLGGYLLGNSEYSDCEVAEVIVFDHVLGSTEINMVGAYLAQKYGLSTRYESVDLAETNMAQTITATLSAAAISNVTVNIKFPTANPAALYHWGYDFYNDGLINLEGNGGLLTTTTYGRVYLTDGPNGGDGLEFENDAEWIASGAVSASDNYMNMIHGYLNVQNTGDHEFRINWDDDIGVIWLDLDMDNVFEHMGAYGDEEIRYDNNYNTLTYNLTAGKSYRFAVVHREGGGGSGIRAYVKSPTMSAQAKIKPTDAQQANLWSYYRSAWGTLNTDYGFSSTSIVITAGSLTGSVTLTPIDDAVREEDENVLIDILSVVNATSGSPASVMATISSDDPEIVNNTVSNITYSSASMAGTLAMGDSGWVTIYYGTNDGGTTKGSWSNSVSMGIRVESEPFSASITGLLANTKYYYRCYATNYSLLGEDWADVTTNFTTLGPTVSIGDRSLIIERDVGTVGLILTVTMSETNASAVSVNFTTLDGTAIAGTDYLGTNGTVTIPAGQTNGQIVVRVINDTVFTPPPRTFDVVLSSPVGCSILDGRARVTILDNDGATYLSDWQYSMQVAFTNSGADMLINWPALVRLSTNITGFSYAGFLSVTGGDLRFSTGDGKSVLVYSMENWNTNGESAVWVQVPQLPVGGTNIWVYWGNPYGVSAPSYTTDSSTWDANYKGTWHLHADAQDATANNIDGTVYGASVVISGAVANAWNFDGANDYIEIARPVQDDFTISFWMRPDIAGRGDANWYNGYGLVDGEMSGSVNDFGIGYNNTGGYNQPVFGTGNPDQTLNSGIAVNDGNWHHVAVTRRKSTGAKIIYVDGVQRASQTGNTVSLTSPAKLKFGEILNGNYNYDGRLDEIRISDTVRSATWISCSYTNQKPGSMANLIGAVRGKPLIVTTNGATNVTATSACLTAYLISTGAAPATVWLCWGTNNGAQVESQWNTVTLMGAVTAFPTNYSTELTTLTAGTAYYYAYMASNTYGKYWAATNFYTTGKPFVENSAGAVEGSVSATLRGNLVSTGGLVTTVFTYWGDNDGGTSTGSWDYVIASGILPQGVFSNDTTVALVYGRQYYYRCYATNSAGVNWATATKLFRSTNPRVNDGSKMKISFPYYVGPTLTNIPMLVQFEDGKLGFSYDGFISGAGNDLRFWNAAMTTNLNYEIEAWGTNYNFEPTTLSGCTLWLDASDIDGYGDGTTGDPTDGQFVTVWKDKSSSGNAARLASGSPVVAANGLGTNPVVRFTVGAAQDMDFDSPVTADGSTVFIMFKKNSNTDWGWQRVMEPYSGNALNMKNDNVSLTGGTERSMDRNGGGMTVYSGVSASEWHIQAYQLTATNYHLWVDERLCATNAYTGAMGPFGDVGNIIGDIAEVIVYNRILTADERQKVGGYLAGKYDLDGGYTPNDQSYVWVQIPQLAASNTYIWATWGDTNYVSKPVYTTNGATWSEGFQGVWHLGGDTKDSTSNHLDAVNTGSTNYAGAATYGQMFDNNDYIRVASGVNISNKNFMVSAWAKRAAAGQDDYIIAHGDIETGNKSLHFGFRNTDIFTFAFWGNDLNTAGTYTDLNWHQWIGRYEAATRDQKLYRDAGFVQQRTASADYQGTSANPFRIGERFGNANFGGVIDEVRVEDVLRSTNWIWACWMNMASNSTFNVYSNAVDSRVIENRPASQVQDIRAQFNGVLYAKSATYDVYVYWGQTDGGTNFYAWSSNAFVGNYTYVFSNNVSYTAQGVQRLIPQTNYFYTFFATNIAGGYWAYPSIALTTEPPYPSLFKIF